MSPVSLEKFDVNAKTGFLPAQDPLTSLPSSYEPWDIAIHRLPVLLIAGQARSYIDQMPQLGIDQLTSEAEFERALLVLSYLGHGYVWGEEAVTNRVPDNIAVPWHAVAQQLDRPPVLSYASYAMHNWRRIRPDKPLTLDNIEILCNFLGGMDEAWFIIVHIAIEAIAGPAIAAAAECLHAAQSGKLDVIQSSLGTIADVLAEITQTLASIYDKCDPHIYYKRVRPYIFGWKENPTLPNGLIYEGVTEWNNEPQKFRGESGAQSAIIPTMDALFGVTFDSSSPFAQHLSELRSYMPVKHQAFVEMIAQDTADVDLRQFIIEAGTTNPDLVKAHNACIDRLSDFRKLHVQIARDYIAVQEEEHANPTAIGTGGTPFLRYLRQHLTTTQDRAIPTSS